MLRGHDAQDEEVVAGERRGATPSEQTMSPSRTWGTVGVHGADPLRRRRARGDIANLRARSRETTASRRSCRSLPRRACTGSRTSTTRATRSSSSGSPTRSARSTARSSTRGSSFRSTTPCSCTNADTMLSSGKSAEDYRAWAEPRVDALNHALAGSRPSASATTCAGAAGTVRTPTTRCSRT